MHANTNHPVRKLGRVPFRKVKILSLAFIQAQEKFAREVDLASLPPLISGGDRKARRKAIAEQQSHLYVPRRVDRHQYFGPESYGMLAYVCPRCRHLMLFDGTWEDGRDTDWNAIKCDRCKSIGGKPPPSRWERVLG